MTDRRRLDPPGVAGGGTGRLRRLAAALAIGLSPFPRGRTIGRVRYRPIGGGQFEVMFPSGEITRVRPGPERVYHDLDPDPRHDAAGGLAELVLPGDRVLILGSGTGESAGVLAEAVGSTGAIVALEHDGESVRFARRRYPHGHCAHEIGGWRSLGGELDGAFDAAMICEPHRAEGDRIASPEMTGEIARVLTGQTETPRGVAIAAALGPARAESIAGLLARRLSGLEATRPRTLRDGWGSVLLAPNEDHDDGDGTLGEDAETTPNE